MRRLIVAAAILPLVGACTPEKLTYQVAAGQSVSVDLFLYVQGCESRGQYRSKVMTPPSHGTFDFRPATIVQTEPPCAGHTFTGSRATYKPAKGFRGTDHMLVQIGYPNDTSETLYVNTEYDVTFVVK